MNYLQYFAVATVFVGIGLEAIEKEVEKRRAKAAVPPSSADSKKVKAA